MIAQPISLDDRGWYPIDVLVEDFHSLSRALDRGSVWVESSQLYDGLCVLESRLSKERGDSNHQSSESQPIDVVSVADTCKGRINSTGYDDAWPGSQVVSIESSSCIALGGAQ